MKISRESPGDEIRYAIRGYGDEGIKVNDEVHATSLIIAPTHLDPDWSPRDIRAWEPSDLDPLLALEPEILLLGTGRRIHMLGTSFQAHALRQGVGIEVMDTEAACRTYNVLASEERRVVAGLIIDRD